MPLTASLARWLNLGIDLLYPRRCAGCRNPLLPDPGVEFCATCVAALPWLNPPLCQRCGEGFAVPSETDAEVFVQRTCARCRAAPPAFAIARSALRYEGPARAAVHAFKFEGRKALGTSLALLLRQHLGAHSGITDSLDGLLAVPLHPARERSRGFNQSAVLAAALSEQLGLPYLAGVVVRVRPTQPQVELDRAARLRNVQGAFEVVRPHLVSGRTVLLVDDVMTTCATAAACARALFRAGAGAVRVATFARG